jgi:transcriptional regulator with XRE-family HTH domain
MFKRDKMKELREAKGFSMRELAEKVGCSEAFISYLENGQKEPTSRMLYFLADALDCSTDYLLGRTDKR